MEFLYLGLSLRQFPKPRIRTTTVIAFYRQNDAGSRAHTTQYQEILVLVFLLVLESKGLEF